MALRCLHSLFSFFLIAYCLGANGINDSSAGSASNEIVVDTGTRASFYPIEEFDNLPGFSSSTAPKALIIHADPKRDSVTSAARDSMAEYLAMKGWELEVHSLYEEGFNPVASEEEAAFFGPAPETTDPVIQMYQRLIREANALVLVYPLWWKQPPAILKGWQDRVFTYGFAYEFVRRSPDSIVSLLTGKKVLFINVVASTEEVYNDQGYLRYLGLADQSLYGAGGMEIAERHIIYLSDCMDISEKRASLKELSNLVSLIEPVGWR
jgi:NAD(P)H dehydrogenase (quinone)